MPSFTLLILVSVLATSITAYPPKKVDVPISKGGIPTAIPTIDIPDDLLDEVKDKISRIPNVGDTDGIPPIVLNQLPVILSSPKPGSISTGLPDVSVPTIIPE